MCHKYNTWDWCLYFPSEGRQTFIALKNPSFPARFKPVNSGSSGQHKTTEGDLLGLHVEQNSGQKLVNEKPAV
jgi:hypothetical protein